MEQGKVQQAWKEAREKFFCGECKAARLLIWEKAKGAEAPQCAVTVGEHWEAVHCDYFRRRIEHPDQLRNCGAFQRREES
jgi:hypothetical protein